MLAASGGPPHRPDPESGYAVFHNGEPVAHTETPEEAVALVAAALPPDLGPAS
ncbi:DUF6193 family natural product biosynthesis protein [Kitasatospora sp. NPDC051853]|uniref:DUF6193 family natural product biosynthesis protein n=1 Tax=Kitasatospora sp. NPDC051853 TaxID=3364058 RepID=UPI0037BAD7D3